MGPGGEAVRTVTLAAGEDLTGDNDLYTLLAVDGTGKVEKAVATQGKLQAGVLMYPVKEDAPATVALLQGIVPMRASAAIAIGDYVSAAADGLVAGNSALATARNTVGIALTAATAKYDVIRVLVTTNRGA